MKKKEEKGTMEVNECFPWMFLCLEKNVDQVRRVVGGLQCGEAVCPSARQSVLQRGSLCKLLNNALGRVAFFTGPFVAMFSGI
jgi:hypothetical protein